MSRRRPKLSFRAAVAQNIGELRRLSESRNQQIPGYTPDEIYGELLSSLWDAYRDWDPVKNPNFAAFAYKVWERNRIDMLRGALRMMRDIRKTRFFPEFSEIFAETNNLGTTDDIIDRLFSLPADLTEEERRLCILIGSGADLALIRDALGRSLYYRLMRSLRTDEFYRLLHHEQDD